MLEKREQIYILEISNCKCIFTDGYFFSFYCKASRNKASRTEISCTSKPKQTPIFSFTPHTHTFISFPHFHLFPRLIDNKKEAKSEEFNTKTAGISGLLDKQKKEIGADEKVRLNVIEGERE